MAQYTSGSKLTNGRRGRGIAPERISHDNNETFRCRTYRSRIGRSASRCKRANVCDEVTRQNAQWPWGAGTAGHIWKFRTDCGDRDSTVDRNVHSALRRCDQLGPDLEQHKSSGQAIVAIDGVVPPARAPALPARPPAAPTQACSGAAKHCAVGFSVTMASRCITALRPRASAAARRRGR